MEKVNIGIIGCGKVAHLHAAALKKLPQANLTAAMSRSPEKVQSFAETYGIEAYTDIDELLAKAGLDAVIICTPHPAHAEPTIKAARAGIHILVEKPLAATLTDCDAMIKVADEAGVKIGVISQRRLFEPVQRVKQAIDAGKIGQPVLGSVHMLGWRDEAYYTSDPWRGSWRGEGGGVLVNQAPHQLDLLQWFMGPVDELFGYWDNLNHPYIEVDDTAVAVIRFKNGALGNILVSNSQRPGIFGKVHVHGQSGASVGVQTDSGAMFIAGMSEIAEPPINDLWTVPGEEELLHRWQEEDRALFDRINATEYYHELQLQDFLQAVLEDREPMITGDEGRKTVELFTAVYRSQRMNRSVKFPLKPENRLGEPV
ncbi:MAG: Gfo/Idh/MocA family oxidoreductase [Fidelibacterota bacterium]|nr:MAG: Gfo/Idh/MocA family oxidoreductase [Candidatus Neomarinimicrobiota bacterium]